MILDLAIAAAVFCALFAAFWGVVGILYMLAEHATPHADRYRQSHLRQP